MSAVRPPPPDASPDLSRPSDLAAGEADVAAFFQDVEARPPGALGGRVLGSFDPAPAARCRIPRGRFLPIALLLLALVGGAVAALSLAARDADVGARARSRTLSEGPAVVLDDPRGPLYRGLEDFRSLDVGRPDEDELAASCGEVGVR